MKVKGLLVIPGQKVQKVRIPSNLKFIRRIVGKNLMRITLDEDTILLFDKNAKKDDFNRVLGSHIINGTFFIIKIHYKYHIIVFFFRYFGYNRIMAKKRKKGN